jgi:hypothetical protein
MINSISLDCDPYCVKPLIVFSCVHTSNLLNGFLSRAEYVSLNIKRLETTLWSPSLPKPLKRSLLQNQQGTKLWAIKTYIKPSHLNQRLKYWSIMIKPWSKTLAKAYKYPLKNQGRGGGGKKRKKGKESFDKKAKCEGLRACTKIS